MHGAQGCAKTGDVPTDPLQLYTLQQVSQLAQRSYKQVLRDTNNNSLRTVTLGRQKRVPRMELERYLGVTVDDDCKASR